MSGLTVDLAVAIVDELCYRYDAEVREDYSGRGMYGKTCVGIVTDAPHKDIIIATIRVFAQDNDGLDIMDILDKVEDVIPSRVDSMGLSTIYY